MGWVWTCQKPGGEGPLGLLRAEIKSCGKESAKGHSSGITLTGE